jgi:hypothetical protein
MYINTKLQCSHQYLQYGSTAKVHRGKEPGKCITPFMQIERQPASTASPTPGGNKCKQHQNAASGARTAACEWSDDSAEQHNSQLQSLN